MNGNDKNSPPKKSGRPGNQKQARRADALRANLQKRKQQTRARAADDTAEKTEEKN